MINVKDQVYSAINAIADFETVTDLYPAGPGATFPCAQITEEANNVYTKTDGEEQCSYLRYRIDIWSTGSTSQLALAVDEALSALGLVRSECADVPDPSNYRHKQMRYEGIIEDTTEKVYWTGNQ